MSKSIPLLRARVKLLQQRVDDMRACPDARKSAEYGALLSELFAAQDRLMMVEDPDTWAFLNREAQ